MVGTLVHVKLAVSVENPHPPCDDDDDSYDEADDGDQSEKEAETELTELEDCRKEEYHDERSRPLLLLDPLLGEIVLPSTMV